MSNEILFSLIEKELDEALSFFTEFKVAMDVLDKRFSDKEQDYKTLVLGYQKLLDEIGKIDKVKYTIVLWNEYNYDSHFPYKHKIEKNVKTEKDDDE